MPQPLTIAGTALAVASFVQAAVQAVALTGGQATHVAPVHLGAAPAGTSSTAGAVAAYAVPVCLLALAATVPLIFLRPAGAAVFITAASVLSLAAFGLVTTNNGTAGLVTAGGVAAQVIAIYRLGAASASGALGTPGESGAARLSGVGTRYLALGLALPFLVLALASRGGAACVLLAVAVPAAAGTGIAVGSGRTASREGLARTELAETLVENMARGERARIARELHDVVAHHISMISVQAETARLTVPDLPPEGARRLREIGDTARAGLTEMRRLLGVLRSDAGSDAVGDRQPQPGLTQIAALIDGSRPSSGGGVRLIVSGTVRSFDPGVELAAYRIVQEALTNARRHAPGAGVDVELRYEPDALRVRVRDTGPGPGDPGPGGTGADDSGKPGTGGKPSTGGKQGTGGGHGLLGMRERAATVGGTLRTSEAPGGGFLVEAELPAKPEAGT